MPGPKGLLQEKFQRTAKIPNEDDGNEWKNLDGFANRFDIRKVYRPSRKEFYSSDETGAPDEGSFTDVRLNYMPPGMFIDNQEPMVTEHKYEYVAAGETDVTNDTTPSTMKHGFRRQNMTPVDDMYNNEHVEEFYGEAKGKDDKGVEYTGFAERNNYLDRN